MADDPHDSTPLPRSLRSANPTDEELCRYIAEQCIELRQEARRPRLRMIGYLLDMVRIEAEKLAKERGERR